MQEDQDEQYLPFRRPLFLVAMLSKTRFSRKIHWKGRKGGREGWTEGGTKEERREGTARKEKGKRKEWVEGGRTAREGKRKGKTKEKEGEGSPRGIKRR
jgi:hypothetical protein